MTAQWAKGDLGLTQGWKLLLGGVAMIMALPILKDGRQAPSFWHTADVQARLVEGSGPVAPRAP
ncbi:hypothetical protein GCM10011415_07040 [Salipiger pallidus]|uniref:Uncharacterized protein n=1 Tax=Salipiger pallidus TaxID=1775170 RepID=A0A8J2ZHH4_9RHOB|nr:hypothetical protein GCM10011415_07040 [Salipiger pallidus]